MQAPSCHTSISQAMGVPAAKGSHLGSIYCPQVSPAPHRNPAQLALWSSAYAEWGAS